MSKTLNKKAIALLREVRSHILEDPRRIAMRVWKSKDVANLPSCGTVACIGGWVEILSGEKGGRADLILGIDHDQQHELFFSPLCVAARQQTPGHARDVARLINRFIRRYEE